MLGYSILGQGRSTLPGVCQLLSSVYQRLLQDRNTVNNLDLQRQALFMEPNGPAPFDTLKMASTSTPILIDLDLAKPFIVETYALDFALGAILSQFGIDGLLHPVALYSRKLTSAEINYQVYDKELLAIITAFE